MKVHEAMSVARQYVLYAMPNRADALGAALIDLSVAIAELEGCERVELLRGANGEGRFLLTEYWVSREAHAQVSDAFPKALLKPVMACVVSPPETAWLDVVTPGRSRG